jgi:hypothetical protein
VSPSVRLARASTGSAFAAREADRLAYDFREVGARGVATIQPLGDLRVAAMMPNASLRTSSIAVAQTKVPLTRGQPSRVTVGTGDVPGAAMDRQ